MLGWCADTAPPDHLSKLEVAVEVAAEEVTIIKVAGMAAAKQAMTKARAVINAASQVTRPETATESVQYIASPIFTCAGPSVSSCARAQSDLAFYRLMCNNRYGRCNQPN